ncbi:unnamed protein product [Arctia plantaginis]|uniref:Uncharacterized protein n=1 Tax=Arctia plantaginis TaxID=874455 RepID=A0A8S1B3P5_ARCPL|nr:unnamed protein product [Arctia plantaginis]
MLVHTRSVFVYFAAAEVTEDDSIYELWRVDNVENEDILREFEIRAHMNDAIWKKNETYYFIVADYELTYWQKLLSNYDIEWKVLGKNLRGIFDDKFLNKYLKATIEIETSTYNLKSSMITTKAIYPESEEIIDDKYPYTTQKIHQMPSPKNEADDVSKSESSEEYFDNFNLGKVYGASELWRADNVISDNVLSEFNDRDNKETADKLAVSTLCLVPTSYYESECSVTTVYNNCFVLSLMIKLTLLLTLMIKQTLNVLKCNHGLFQL